MKKSVIIGGVVLVLGAAGYFFLIGGSPVRDETIAVRRGTIIREITVTAKTKPHSEVALAFERGGRIAAVRVAVGQRVLSGDTLVELDSTQLNAKVREAEANRAAAHARLDALLQGPREEEVAVAQIKADNAEMDLNDALKNLTNTLQDSYIKADDTIRTKIDRLFVNPRGNDPLLAFSSGQTTYEGEIIAERMQFEPLLLSWRDTANTLANDAIPVSALTMAEDNLRRVHALLEKCSLVVSALTASQNLTQTTIDAYRSDISTGRTVIAKTLADLLAVVNRERSAEAALALAQSQLALVRAPTTPEGVREQEARVQQTEAAIASLRAEAAQAALHAPFAGVVTRQDAKVGEIVAATVPLISIISASALEIQANIPEGAITLIKKGQPVRIAVDAFADEEFFGTVAAIDPAETMIEGAVAYRVTVAFARSDERLKSGLTATLTIEAIKKSAVLVLPFSAVTETEDGSFVQRSADNPKNTPIKVPITLGVRGSDGSVEIVSGLAEGDRVLANSALPQ